jgi:ATP-binding cassette subfamily F protein 3
VLEGDGQTRVIHGNYDTYERMRVLQAGTASARGAKEKEKERVPVGQPAKRKRKRRFPYRKVEDLETEIAGAETRLRELEQLLASPELYRDGERVKGTTRSFEETKAQLQQLYEHWEEAVEFN